MKNRNAEGGRSGSTGVKSQAFQMYSQNLVDDLTKK